MSKANIVPISDQPATQEESPNRLSFTLEEMLKEFENGAVPRSKFWQELITALYDTANHVVTGVTAVADVKPDNLGNIPLLPSDIDAPPMVRMEGADERERQSTEDVFGRQLFYGDACKVVHQYGHYYEVLSGNAYVAGIRFFYPGKQDILIEEDDLPTFVWLDVSQQGSSMSDVRTVVEVVVSDQELSDYVDDNGIIYYLENIANVDHSGTVIDNRTITITANALRAEETQSVTHLTFEDAVRDDNGRRKYIRVGDRIKADYREAINQYEFDSYGDTIKFIDNGNNNFIQQFEDEITDNELGIEEGENATAKMLDIVNYINNITKHPVKLIVNKNITLDSLISVSADGFELAGDGIISVDKSISESHSQILQCTGKNQKITIAGFDGNRDNTNREHEAPQGSMVVMSGENPLWNSTTKNAQGYAVTIIGKNPTVINHRDTNSHYSGFRFMPAEPWDYIIVGDMYLERTAGLPAVSTRGCVFNGQHEVDFVKFNSYKTKGTGFLIDSVTDGSPDERTVYFKKMHINSLVIDSPIPSTNTSVGLNKFENVGDLTIDYCYGFTDDKNDQRGFWFACEGDIKIGYMACNQPSRLGNNVSIDTFYGFGDIRTNELILPVSSNEKLCWHIGRVLFGSEVHEQISTKSIISLNNLLGTKCHVNSYSETDKPANLIRLSAGCVGAFSCDEPDFTNQVGSGEQNSFAKRLKRQIIVSTLDNLQGNIVRGDIFYRLNPSAGSKVGWICTTAGVAGSTAVLKEFGNIEV